jgi:hypothetical protein
MNDFLRPTAHATTRMSQRGIANDAIDLIKWIGTEVEGGVSGPGEGFSVIRSESKALAGPR